MRHKVAVANLSKGGGMKNCPPSLPSPSSSSSSSSSSSASSAHQSPRFVPASPSSPRTQPARGAGVGGRDAGQEEDEEGEDAGAEATRFLNREQRCCWCSAREEEAGGWGARRAARSCHVTRVREAHILNKKSQLEALCSTYKRALRFENGHIEASSDPTQRGGSQARANARRRTRLEVAPTTVHRTVTCSTLPAISLLPRGQRLPSTFQSETQRCL